MQHPYAYPEVFVSVFLGLDLDVTILAECATVCRAWRDFIHGYLWNSERVKVSYEILPPPSPKPSKSSLDYLVIRFS